MTHIKSAYLDDQLKRWMRPDAHHFVRPDWRRFIRPGFEDDHIFALYERKYSPEQPRVPAGSREGGQWTDGEGGGDEEIPANAKPAQYSPSKEGWHQYQAGPNNVCTPDLQCSREEIAAQLSRYSLPGRGPSQPVETGGTYPVYADGIKVGTVRTTISEDGLTITNKTLEGHIFYDGKIVRKAKKDDDGSWTITTEGTGNNVYPGMNKVNERVGPGIFDSLDLQMRDNIERHHAKAIDPRLEHLPYAHGVLARRGGAGGKSHVEF